MLCPENKEQKLQVGKKTMGGSLKPGGIKKWQ